MKLLNGVMVMARAVSVPKYRKAGIVRLSSSKKVVLLAIYELDRSKWLFVDAEKLSDLITGHRFDVPIMERNPHC